MFWRGFYGICAVIYSTIAPTRAIPKYLQYSLEQLTAPSKNQVKHMANPHCAYRLEKGGVAITNQGFPHYELHRLPKTGMPILRTEPNPAAKVRLILLPGSGSDSSTVATLIKKFHLFEELNAPDGAPVKHDRAQFIRDNLPSKILPYEIVGFEMPGAGWAPPITAFKDGVEMSRFVADVITEINEERPMVNVAIAISASAPLTLVAKGLGAPLHGAFLYGATYPDARAIEENRADVRWHHERGDYVANWPVLDGYFDRILEPKFVRALRDAGRSDFRVLNIIGENDGQVPARSRELWAETLRVNRAPVPSHRRQYIIPDVGHFVFEKHAGNPPSWQEPDVQVFGGAVEFIYDTYRAATFPNET